MEEKEKRSRIIGEAIKPLMGPGDVALVIGADDSRTLFWGDDYIKAYAQGTLTAKHTYWAVFLAFRIFLENMEFHKKFCMPEEEHGVSVLNIDPKLEDFLKAKASGTLTPEDTFRIIAGMNQEMLVMLEGHMAACMPGEFTKMVERLNALKAPKPSGENAS